MTSSAVAGYNHFNCSRGCSQAPLTLLDREIITGRGDIRCYDETSGAWFCGDCLADLPEDQGSHVCGEPEPVQLGNIVRYHGSLSEYCGLVWEVTHIDERGLVLFDVDRALWNVSPASVTVLRKTAAGKAA